jgi:hypothetical protein
MRLVLLIPILAATLQAGPITVVETTSPVGTTNLFYSFDVPSSPGPVTATVNGSANCLGGIPQCGNQYATASINLTMDLYSSGPIRGGIALVQLIISGGGDAGGAIQVSGGIGPYSLGSCPKELTCQIAGYFPFELGVPFTIDLNGLADGNPQFFGGASFQNSAYLQLYELPAQAGDRTGAPVQINLVPEPDSAALAFTGLVALVLFGVKRSRLSLRLRLRESQAPRLH